MDQSYFHSLFGAKLLLIFAESSPLIRFAVARVSPRSAGAKVAGLKDDDSLLGPGLLVELGDE